MKTKVIVCTEYSEQARAELLTRFGDRFDITFDEHAASLGDAEICIGEPPLALVQQAEKLRWVQMTWAGTDIYTRRTGFPERVTLTNASGAFGRTISEYVLGGILTMYRNFPAYREQQKQAVWRTVGAERTLYGRTVLILGTGDLGSNVAKRLRGFGTVNIGVRRAAGETLPYFDEVRGIAELDKLLPQADIVIGCLPNTPGTAGLLTETRLRRMKQDALLVNVGRGTLLSTAELAAVLADGHLSGAVLDVCDTEPLPPSSPLWGMENVLLTPHVSGRGFGHDRGTEHLIWEIVMDNLARYLEGKNLRHIVDINRGY